MSKASNDSQRNSIYYKFVTQFFLGNLTNRIRTPVDMMNWLKDIAVSSKAWENLSPQQREEKLIIGAFLDVDKPDYCALYTQLLEKAREEEVR